MARTLFQGGSIFDGSGGDPAPGDLVVEDGRVVDIGSGLDGDEAVDVGGCTVLPGLFDCHVHVDVQRRRPDGGWLQHAVLVPVLRRRAEPAHDAGRRHHVASATPAAPTWASSRRVDDGLDPAGRACRSRSRMIEPDRRARRRLDAVGRRRASVCAACPGLPETRGRRARRDAHRRCGARPGRRRRDQGRHVRVACSRRATIRATRHFRDDELQVLVDEATAAGIFVMAHAQATDGIKTAIRTGIRSIEHGIYLDDEAIDMMLHRGTLLVPTLIAPRGVLDAADAGVRSGPGDPRQGPRWSSTSTASRSAERSRPASGSPWAPTRGVTPARPEPARAGAHADWRDDARRGAGRDHADRRRPARRGRRAGHPRARQARRPRVVRGDAFALETLPERIVSVWQDGVRVDGLGDPRRLTMPGALTPEHYARAVDKLIEGR